MNVGVESPLAILTWYAVFLAFAIAIIRRIPHPGSLWSWLAVANEALAGAAMLVIRPGLLLFSLVLVATAGLFRPSSVRVRPAYIPGEMTLWGFAARRLARSLWFHRGVASQRGQISHVTACAFCSVHYWLATVSDHLRDEMLRRQLKRAGWQYDLAARQINEAMRRQVAAHARLALFYAELFGLPRRRNWIRLEMHLVLAGSYLVASLDAEQETKTLLREAGLASLADAVKARWLSPRMSGRRIPFLAGHVRRLQEMAQRLELHQETRLSTLLSMLDAGTTGERLSQMRSSIQPGDEDRWWLSEEREERQWAEALVPADGGRLDVTLVPSGNDARLLPQVRGWNWGAFLLSWVWALAHRLRVWGALGILVWLLLPCLGTLVLGFYLGIHGNELAWRARHFGSVEEYRATQKVWTSWGIPLGMLLLVPLPLVILAMLCLIVRA